VEKSAYEGKYKWVAPMAKTHGIGDIQKKVERAKKKYVILLVLMVSLLLSVLAALIVLIYRGVLLSSWPIFTLVLALSSLILLLFASIIR